MIEPKHSQFNAIDSGGGFSLFAHFLVSNVATVGERSQKFVGSFAYITHTARISTVSILFRLWYATTSHFSASAKKWRDWQRQNFCDMFKMHGTFWL